MKTKLKYLFFPPRFMRCRLNPFGYTLGVIILMPAIFFTPIYSAYGEEAIVVPESYEEKSYYDEKTGERVVSGLHFKIAEDRKMEKSGKYIEPEGLDKYLGRKFEKLYGVIEELSGRITAIDERITRLEESIAKLSIVEIPPEEQKTEASEVSEINEGYLRIE